MVLNSTFSIFNSTLYKQIFGTSMELSLSPIVADMVMQDLEEIAIGRLPCRLLFYFRYVDYFWCSSESVDDL